MNLNDYGGSTVMVRWTDSGTHHADGWQTAAQIVKAAKTETVTTVGQLFHWDEKNIYVGQTWDESYQHFFGTQIIHRPEIVSIRLLKEDTD